MANAKDISSSTAEASILVVGDSGTHKTYFLGTVPDIIIYDFDAGMAINRGKDLEYHTFKDAPFGVKVPKSLAERGVYPWGTAWPAFVDHMNNVTGKQIDEGRMRPIGIDSLTTLSNIAMNYVLKGGNKKPSDSKTFGDWGQQIGLVETVMEQLTSWPVMLIATAHIQRDTNQMMETVEMLPLLTGKLAGRIALYFDEVWYTDVRKAKDAAARPTFHIQSHSSGMIKQAKTRYDVPSGTELDWGKVGSFIVGS